MLASFGRFGFFLAVITAASPLCAQQPPANQKATVELRWVEGKKIKGLTETKGFQCSCDPKSIVYPHRLPALVLTAAEVRKVSWRNHNLSGSGLSATNYNVTIELTEAAKKKLAASAKREGTTALTVVVDGRYWGVHRYEIDKSKRFVPKQARAETFWLSVGFFRTRLEAKRLVDALR